MAPGPVPTPTLGMISLWLHLYLSNIDSSEKSLVAQGLFSQSLKVEKSSLKWMEKWGWKLDLDPRFSTVSQFKRRALARDPAHPWEERNGRLAPRRLDLR